MLTFRAYGTPFIAHGHFVFVKLDICLLSNSSMCYLKMKSHDSLEVKIIHSKYMASTPIMPKRDDLSILFTN
jgi:hypothetical protein